MIGVGILAVCALIVALGLGNSVRSWRARRAALRRMQPAQTIVLVMPMPSPEQFERDATRRRWAN